jgi:hypothetical protein
LVKIARSAFLVLTVLLILEHLDSRLPEQNLMAKKAGAKRGSKTKWPPLTKTFRKTGLLFSAFLAWHAIQASYNSKGHYLPILKKY